MYNLIYPRNVLEFSYRYSNKDKANVFISFSIDTQDDLNRVIQNLKESIESNIFFRDKVDNKYFIYAMVRLIAVPIILFYRYTYDNFGACKYNLPFNWN